MFLWMRWVTSVFQKSSFLRLRAFKWFLTVYFWKKFILEFIRILSWFKVKNIKILVSKILDNLFLCEKYKKFPQINFSVSGHLSIFSNQFLIFSSHNPRNRQKLIILRYIRCHSFNKCLSNYYLRAKNFRQRNFLLKLFSWNILWWFYTKAGNPIPLKFIMKISPKEVHVHVYYKDFCQRVHVYYKNLKQNIWNQFSPVPMFSGLKDSQTLFKVLSEL